LGQGKGEKDPCPVRKILLSVDSCQNIPLKTD
jgi:hypothetical protein